MIDNEIAAALGRLVPDTADLEPDWEGAVARARRQTRARRVPLLAAAVLLACALLAVIAVNPFGTGTKGSLVERALAAVGQGPVLHVVYQTGPPVDAVINRQTGEVQNHVQPEAEIWYDASRGVHLIARIGPLVLDDELSPAGRVSELDQLALLAHDYTDALASGRATLAGEGEVNGTPIYWIQVSETATHSTTNGQRVTHTQAREVAITQDGYTPVATRTTIDGSTDGLPIQRIASFETLADGEGNFAAPPTPPRPNLGVLCCSTETTTLANAPDVIGQRPLWLGDTFAGLPLRRVARVEAQTNSGHGGPFTGTFSALELFYGSLDEHGQPDDQQPHVRVLEAKATNPITAWGFLTHIATAPPGWELVNGQTGSTTQDGIAVEIQTSSHNPDAASVRTALAGLDEAP